jgi:hypothetical protein
MKKSIVKFKPILTGLHTVTVNLKDNPEAAYLLVNDVDLTFPTSPDSLPLKPNSHHVHVPWYATTMRASLRNKSNR